jgi:glycine cleavage system H protein
MYPADLKYTKDHEWIRTTADTADVGITDYAQQQLGDVVFVELPQVGRTLAQGEVFGTIESVKAVSELFSPVAGEVVAVNDALTSAPEQVNSDPHAAWIIRVRPSNPSDLDALLDAAAYEQQVG